MAAREQWWVVPAPGGIANKTALYLVIESPSRPRQTVAAGPFPTKAQAEEWIADKEKSPIKLPTPPNPLSGLSDIGKIAHWVGDAVLHIFDLPMWRSIGWIVLGVALMWLGVYLWFRTSQTYENLQSAIVGSVKAL